MKILFVWPNKDQFGRKPISIALLSAILKSKGYDVDLFDTTFFDFGFEDNSSFRTKIRIFKEADFSAFDVKKKKINLEETLIKKLNEFKPDICAVSALSDEISIGFEISKIVKKWNAQTIVVWGNKAATMAPEKVFACKYIDFLCIGEGIEFLPDFVECIAKGDDPRRIENISFRDNGRIVRMPVRPYYQKLDSLPFLDWTIFDKRQFINPYDGRMYRFGDYMIYWGCPYYCTYCINASYRKIYGKNAGPFLRCYSVDRVIKELKYLVNKWQINFFRFHDEDFCLKSIKYLDDLTRKYSEEINIPFSIMANAHNINLEKIRLLKKMNCVSVTLGIETGNTIMRKKILKRLDSKKEIIESTKMLNDAGIRTSSFNMLGIPFESRKTVMETIELNRKAQVRYPNVGFFSPLEETELREIAIKNGFLNKNRGVVFKDGIPNLDLPDISKKELIALIERFVLYIKMPKVFYKYIERSERKDKLGKRLTSALYKIYDECVFVNDGFWNDYAKVGYYIKILSNICKKDARNYSV
ncbi:MAG: radical SAM protein [Candidatus Omnitrophica bacterium]|nr:radical SAM protein [Candidatus Omnitrophota bacterium]MDD5352660.1 radical SAM protein [Candidatus Omnitrophota bacterium]MDD5550259.1 radical SAM protein [Candidatus Omnitrophota bacterium]